MSKGACFASLGGGDVIEASGGLQVWGVGHSNVGRCGHYSEWVRGQTDLPQILSKHRTLVPDREREFIWNTHLDRFHVYINHTHMMMACDNNHGGDIMITSSEKCHRVVNL